MLKLQVKLDARITERWALLQVGEHKDIQRRRITTRHLQSFISLYKKTPHKNELSNLTDVTRIYATSPEHRPIVQGERNVFTRVYTKSYTENTQYLTYLQRRSHKDIDSTIQSILKR